MFSKQKHFNVKKRLKKTWKIRKNNSQMWNRRSRNALDYSSNHCQYSFSISGTKQIKKRKNLDEKYVSSYVIWLENLFSNRENWGSPPLLSLPLWRGLDLVHCAASFFHRHSNNFFYRKWYWKEMVLWHGVHMEKTPGQHTVIYELIVVYRRFVRERFSLVHINKTRKKKQWMHTIW